MKLLTTIAPRTDGTFIHTEGAKRYVFTADETGDLVCDIDDDKLVGKLLALPHFEPVDEADYDKAEQLLKAAQPAVAGEVSDEVDDEGEFFSETVNGGLPVEGAVERVAPKEAQTPPAPRKPGRPAKARTAATA
jgi:hypothetical protein